VQRFEGLCRAIIEAGLNDIDYTVQAMTSLLLITENNSPADAV
jgi:hypothetical protein